MAKLTINRGTLANDGTGDNLRDGANKINLNFDEIYTASGNGTTVDGTVKFADDSSTVATISANGETLRVLGGSGIDTTISGNDLTISTDGTVLSASQVSTLTNKSISLTTNTITGTTAEFNTALTDNDFATLAGSETLTNKTINGPDNTLTNIANGSLANSTITLGSDTINLGDTTTTITGLSLDGTGTIDLTGSGSKARFNFAGFGSLPTAATYEGMFAYDTTGQVPNVADAGGWTRIQTENDSISVHSDVNLTGIADNYILKWSSAQARFNVVADSGGATDLTISDDSSTQGTITLATDVLGLVGGTGISTTVDPGNKTITITNTKTFTTDKSNTGDGSTTAFTINSGRTVDDILVIVNGIVLTPTDDYTVSGTTLTFTSAPAASAGIVIRYLG